jgi:hypothetical protein
MYEVYKNSVIVPYEDDAGITNTAYSGERILGTDFFTGEELADLDDVISRRFICDRCGFQPNEKSELIKQNGFMVCWRCLDE